MSIDRWMHKEDVVHIYSGILLSHKKEWNNVICTNMDATSDYHTEWSKSERERQIPYDNTYTWNLKYGTNEPVYKTKIDSQIQRTDLWLPRGKRVGQGCIGSLGWVDVNYSILYTGWINNTVLLYSTGNYIQYPVINHNGKEYIK